MCKLLLGVKQRGRGSFLSLTNEQLNSYYFVQMDVFNILVLCFNKSRLFYLPAMKPFSKALCSRESVYSS